MTKLKTFANDFEKLYTNFNLDIFSKENIKKMTLQLEEKRLTINNSDYTKIKNAFGVYVFYIKPLNAYNYNSLVTEWTQKGYEKYPKVSKKRFEGLGEIETSKTYPFYIGKTEKLGERLKQHIEHKGKISTYSLKLNGRNKFTKDNISFSYWLLPTELNENKTAIKQFIITELERKLRGELKPWIGKQ